MQGGMAAEEVDDVLPLRRQAYVDDRRADRGDEGLARVAAVLGVVIGALEIIDVRSYVHVGGVAQINERAVAAKAVEHPVLRWALAGDVDLKGGREGPVALISRSTSSGRRRGAIQSR